MIIKNYFYIWIGINKLTGNKSILFKYGKINYQTILFICIDNIV